METIAAGGATASALPKPDPAFLRESPRPRFALRAQYAPALLGLSDKRPRRLRARSVRDAAQTIAAPDKLAKILGRPRQLADNWLPVSIPDALALAYGGGVSAEAGRALLRSRLARLCAWLDARLDEPPRVVELGPCRQITVFACVGYDIDFVSRQVSAVRIHPNGARQALSHEVELLQPLSTAYWLHWVLAYLGLGETEAQLSLFGAPPPASGHDDWLADSAYRLLGRDPRFEDLRRVALPHALALDRDVVALALRARHAHWLQNCVPRSTFNLVWRHAEIFRRLARENPQLLKLLELFLAEEKLASDADPVAGMRDYFRACGLSEAAWRYVHQHGSRLFRVAWEMSTNKSRVEVCVHYLRVLEAAGLPPPPAPALAAAWFRCFINLQEDRLNFSAAWCKIDPTVIRAVLLEADQRRREPGFHAHVGEVLGVLHWAIDTGLRLNPQQARAGWRWLHRLWLAWCRQRARQAAVCNLEWESRLPHTTIGRFDVVPIESGEGLIEEAVAMHNCADNFAGQCKSDDIRIFSVRDAGSGKRVATLGIISFGDFWTEYQVKRSANRPAGRELEQLMAAIARLYTERCEARLARSL